MPFRDSLELPISRAAPAAIERGLQSAIAVIDAAQTSAEACAEAYQKVTHEAPESITDRDRELAAIWIAADAAAVGACCAGWVDKPKTLQLKLLPDVTSD